MPRQPSGAYLLPASDVNPPVFNTVINQTTFAAQNNDIATEITNSVDRTGRGGMQANLPMGGFKLTGAGAAVAATDGTILSDITGYLPAGAIMEFAMSTAPAGWLECDGSAISRTGANTALFAAIGTTWGIGDGSTTFNLPDFRAYFRRGWDHGRNIDTGRAFASFQSGTFGSHTHTIAIQAGTAGVGGGQPIMGAGGSTTTAATGGTENKPANYAVLVCIRT